MSPERITVCEYFDLVSIVYKVILNLSLGDLTDVCTSYILATAACLSVNGQRNEI